MSQASEFPTEAGFYTCFVNIGGRKEKWTPAVVEVCGTPPYLRAFLYCEGNTRELRQWELERTIIDEKIYHRKWNPVETTVERNNRKDTKPRRKNRFVAWCLCGWNKAVELVGRIFA